MMSAISFEHLQVGACRHGWMVWPKSDVTIGKALSLYGEFAEGENRVMGRYVSTGASVVDVGANVGTTVLALARAVGAGGTVLAFEPQPLMAQCLQTSLTLNELFQVRVVHGALGQTPGWSTMQAPPVQAGGNYGSMALGTSGIAVPVMTLDEWSLARVDLIKIDVEGYEWAVVQGALETIRKHRPVLYLEAKRLAGTVSYLQCLMDLGYQCYWHFAAFFRSDNWNKRLENAFGGVGDMNVLALPPQSVQPVDLPRISHSTEDWRTVYEPFFMHTRQAMP